jgi:enoyl-CoA hydratase
MSDLLIDRRGGFIFATLNRPEVLNALNFPIIRGLAKVLDDAEHDPGVIGVCLRGAGERAFCAGGDIKAAREGGLAWKRGEIGLEETLQFFEEEYALNRRLFHFKKPLIALMDGIVMGGGVGVAGPCRYKVATEKTKWAMPEVTIGFFPDVGAGYYLTRAPGHTGTFLGLTGTTVSNTADLLACNFASHVLPSDQLERLVITLNTVHDEEELEAVLNGFHMPPAQMDAFDQSWIDQYFSHENVAAIIRALDEGDDAAIKTAALIRSKSPTSLSVTLKHLQLSKNEGFDQVSRRDMMLAEKFLRGEDLYEGIRAAVIDKDKNPKWQPEAAIETYFV